MRLDFDIVVVGNGVLGLSTAFALALEESHLHIGVIGPSDLLQGATPAAGAMLGCFGEVTSSTFESAYSQSKLDISLQAKNLWPEWIDQINELADTNHKLRLHHGTFVLLNACAGKRENINFNSIIKALKIYGEPFEEYDPAKIPGLKPIDNCRPLRSLFLPNEGLINSYRLFHSLNEAIKKLPNITIINDVVTSLKTSFDKIESLQIKNGKVIKANTIVMAAGAYSQSLIDQIPELAERIPPLLSGTGCSLLLKHSPCSIQHVIRSPNRAGSCGIHIMPQHDGINEQTFFMGSSNHVSLFPTSTPKTRDIYYLLQRAMEQFNQDLHNAEIIKWSVGNRPVTIDAYPLIGRTSFPNFWLITGNYRVGLHDSPLLAKSIAKQILGKPALFKNIFPPERKFIQTKTKQQAIEEVTEQYMSASYEHFMKMPKIGWDNTFREMWQTRVEIIYDELEIDFGLPPDIFIMVEQNNEAKLFVKKYFKELKLEYNALAA